MPKRYEKWRQDFRRMFGPVEVDGLIHLHVTAVRKLPKRTDYEIGDFCTAGPDSDNTVGAVMDALFKDDKCVVSHSCVKIWGHRDYLEVTLTEVFND
jgi:Holliday junction resolvase RusA-like endonuclease